MSSDSLNSACAGMPASDSLAALELLLATPVISSALKKEEIVRDVSTFAGFLQLMDYKRSLLQRNAEMAVQNGSSDISYQKTPAAKEHVKALTSPKVAIQKSCTGKTSLLSPKKDVLQERVAGTKDNATKVVNANPSIFQRLVKMSETYSFLRLYDESKFPVQIIHCSPFNKLKWIKSFEEIPIQNSQDTKGLKEEDLVGLTKTFLLGLRELRQPYRFVSLQGSIDLINNIPTSSLSITFFTDILRILRHHMRLTSSDSFMLAPILHILLLLTTRLIKARTEVEIINLYEPLLPLLGRLFGNKKSWVSAAGESKLGQIVHGRKIGHTISHIIQEIYDELSLNIKSQNFLKRLQNSAPTWHYNKLQKIKF